MEETRKKTKIVKRPARLPVSFVSVIFILIVVYFIIQGIILIRHHSIQAFNVGIPASDSLTGSHEGIILRDEKLFYASVDGYVNLYAASGEWLAKETLALSIDPSGALQERIRTLYYGHSVLSYASRVLVQNAIKDAVATYDPMDFTTVEHARREIEAAVMNALLKEGGSELQYRLEGMSYTPVKTEESGFFLNWFDGYENKTPESLTETDYTQRTHKTHYVESGQKIKSGELLYKLASDNRFQVCFLMTEEERVSLSAKKTLSIRTSDGTVISGDFSITSTADRKTLGVITFQKYGANYTSGRYCSFRIVDESVTGFKIPETSIVEKTFFVIPKSYVAVGGSTGNEQGVMVLEGGKLSFVSATVYVRNGSSDEQNFVVGEDSAYVYAPELKTGMTIVSSGDDKATTTLQMSASVEGCFQINNGYCIFKPIVRIRNSLDTSFVVVSASVKGGLKSYDRIVLDAAGLSEREIVFE